MSAPKKITVEQLRKLIAEALSEEEVQDQKEVVNESVIMERWKRLAGITKS